MSDRLVLLRSYTLSVLVLVSSGLVWPTPSKKCAFSSSVYLI